MSIRKNISGLIIGASIVMAALADASIPPKFRSVSQWAAEEMILPAEIGTAHPGPYNPNLIPYAAEVMDACGPDDPSRIVAMRASAQSGKSTIAQAAVGHRITDAPCGMFGAFPTHHLAQRYIELKFQPVINESPVLARSVYRRYGDVRSTQMRKLFRGGYMQFGSANDDKNLQMVTYGFVLAEEIADWPVRDVTKDNRGDPFDQIMARGTTYGDYFKIICPSTTGLLGKCRITDLVKKGDDRYLFNPCPHCDDYFSLRFDFFDQYEGRTIVVAPCCGSVIEHSDKSWMMERAVFVPCFESENPDNPLPFAKDKNGKVINWVIHKDDFEAALSPKTGRYIGRDTEGRDKSFSWWQGQSTLPNVNWKQIWTKWIDAKDDPIKLIVFYQQVLGEPYEAAVDVPKADKLFAMRGGAPDPKVLPLRRGIIPSWAGFILHTVDTQGSFFATATWAFGPGPTMALIDHGLIEKNPLQEESWTDLTHLLNREFPSNHLRPQTAVHLGIDTAGNHTQAAYRFVISNPNILGLKAMTGPKARFEPIMQQSRRGGKLKNAHTRKTVQRIPLWHPNTHLIKKVIYNGFHNALDSYDMGERVPGLNIFFHEDTELEIFKQATAEYLKVDKMRDNEKWEMIANRPNEMLDLAVYAYACAVSYGLLRMGEDDWRALFEREAISPLDMEMGPLEKLMAMPGAAPTSIPRPAPKRPSWMIKNIENNKRS